MSLTLTREVRVGLHSSEEPAGSHHKSSNGFAGNPALTGIAPFLLLRASLVGEVDAATGMLINIKIVDQVLREHAVPMLREGHYVRREAPGLMLPRLFELLAGKFAPHRLTRLTLALSPYLMFCVDHEERQMVKTSQRFEFSAAHRLHAESISEKQNQEIFGRCNNPNGHGHNYEVEVTLSGTPDAATGTVLPGGVLRFQQIVNEHVVDHFDHKHLNLDCAEFRTLNPTVENIARVIYQKLKGAIPGPAKLHCVKVWETPKTVAEYAE
jgi:6-pyruvoyltetrahydropterin/6-carboxytetrahydropterin synthase